MYVTYKYKLYSRCDRNKYLHREIDAFAGVYNHFIALHKRYYRRFKKYPGKYTLIKHLTNLKKTVRFSHWRLLPSQALQNVIERIDFGYQKFFAKDNKRPPKFRSKFKYKSYTLKQAGYKFLDGNKMRIGKRVFRYHKSRDFAVDSVKTVTIKRDSAGDLWLCVVAKAEAFKSFIVKTGKTAGFDFGLKTYLTASDGTKIQSPLFFNRNSRRVKKANRNLSGKKKGSNNRHSARVNLARVHRRVANQRRDYHWQLAYQLCKEYDVMCFEKLNIKAMKQLWGRKISDLGFSDFLTILKYVAKKTGKHVTQVRQGLPSSKTCSACDNIKENLELRERTFHCCKCGLEIDRDLNAAINIHRWGRPPLAEVA
ncbi:MAG: transposase [Candidatus Latescibacteria bacterium]|nr:transposase [Candidatus Latescibacterota bacterium]